MRIGVDTSAVDLEKARMCSIIVFSESRRPREAVSAFFLGCYIELLIEPATRIYVGKNRLADKFFEDLLRVTHIARKFFERKFTMILMKK